jgi:flagellar biosynthetic protein FliO
MRVAMKQLKFNILLKMILSSLIFSTVFTVQAFAVVENPVSSGLFPAFIRMLSVLCLVVGAIILLAYVFKKLNFQGKFLLNTKKCMEVAETIYLGQKKSVTLLKVGKEFFLLGVSNNGINFLSKIDPHPELDDIPGSGDKSDDFHQLLEKKCAAGTDPAVSGRSRLKPVIAGNSMADACSNLFSLPVFLGKTIKRRSE